VVRLAERLAVRFENAEFARGHMCERFIQYNAKATPPAKMSVASRTIIVVLRFLRISHVCFRGNKIFIK
jgi:hypothetical protein